MDFIYKHRNKLFVIASILILIPFLFNIGLGEDEPFTMGIIQHSYSEIINLTTMDVHPPLYYFILKFFLSITTFWTSNIFIKIIFARLLSVIFAAITFIYLLKILNILNIKYNKYTNLFLFMILPLNLGIISQLAHIRMYSIGICLGVMEIFYLLQYIYHPQKYTLFIATFLAVMSMYNNYYLAIYSCLYLFILFLYFLYSQKYKKASYIFVCGVISLVLFLPWMPHLIIQSSMSSHNIDVGRMMRTIVEFMIITVSCSFAISPNIGGKKIRNLRFVIITNILISLIILIVNIIINAEVTSIRYMGTPLIINLIISYNIYINKLPSQNRISKLIMFIVPLLLLLSFTDSLYKQITQYNLPSISFVKKFNKVKNNPNNNINTNNYGLECYSWNGSGNAIYLQSINKNIINTNYYASGVGSNKLYKEIFYNVKHFHPLKK